MHLTSPHLSLSLKVHHPSLSFMFPLLSSSPPCSPAFMFLLLLLLSPPSSLHACSPCFLLYLCTLLLNLFHVIHCTNLSLFRWQQPKKTTTLTSPHLTSPHLTSPHLTSPLRSSPQVAGMKVKRNNLLLLYVPFLFCLLLLPISIPLFSSSSSCLAPSTTLFLLTIS